MPFTPPMQQLPVPPGKVWQPVPPQSTQPLSQHTLPSSDGMPGMSPGQISPEEATDDSTFRIPIFWSCVNYCRVEESPRTTTTDASSRRKDYDAVQQQNHLAHSADRSLPILSLCNPSRLARPKLRSHQPSFFLRQNLWCCCSHQASSGGTTCTRASAGRATVAHPTSAAYAKLILRTSCLRLTYTHTSLVPRIAPA